MLFAGTAAGQGHPKSGSEGSWAQNFYRQGADGPVEHLASTGSHLVLSGIFDAVADRHAVFQALWDGDNASPMGDHLTNVLGEFEGRPAAGLISYRGGRYVVDVALWDGERWETIGETDDYVSALATFEGKLVAAGNFSVAGGVAVNSIATWDGSSWAPLGEGISAYYVLLAPFFHLQGGVSQLVVFDGDLYATGAFIDDTSGSLVHGVKRWDGSTWEFTQTSSGVTAAVVYDGRLVVGGFFSSIGGVSAKGLAEFDGTAWNEFEGGAPTTAVMAMGVYGSDLIIAGGTGFQAASPLWRWDSTSWQPLGSALTYGTNAPYIGGFSNFAGKLYAGGRFDRIAGVAADNIAMWDGNSWTPLGKNGDGVARTAMNICGYGNRAVVYGFGLNTVGDQRAGTAAAWDGKSWTPLGQDSCVTLISVIEHDGALFAIGNVGCPNTFSGLLQWDGNQWNEIGGPLEPPSSLFGSRLSDAGALIYVGGRFDHAGGVAANNIAAWDGTAYHPLGEGVSGAKNLGSPVRDMVQYRGDLVVAGDFTMAGTEAASCIARWDGSQWHPLAEGVTDTHPDYFLPGPSVQSLAVFQGDLIAIGHFIYAGDQVANGLARWDGKRWHSFEIEWEERPVYMTVFHGELVVDGAFTEIGGTPARKLAAWNGKQWREFGGGLPEGAGQLVSFHESLFLASASVVGPDIVSLGIAQWRPGNSSHVAEAGGEPSRGGEATGPSTLYLPVNVPNPFNPETSIRFDLSRAARVRVTIYDAHGSPVTTLLDEDRPAGRNQVTWLGRDGSGRTVPSGIYFVVVDAGDLHGTRKITLLK